MHTVDAEKADGQFDAIITGEVKLQENYSMLYSREILLSHHYKQLHIWKNKTKILTYAGRSAPFFRVLWGSYHHETPCP